MGGCQAELLLLTAIVVLAAAFRIPRLDVVPPGLSLDEASRGYDAYSLLLTGADQYGVGWPLFTESMADHVGALFTYLVIPFVAVLGLTETAVRLPAAILGVATVPALYGLARPWFGRTAALVTALCAAVSAWHILPSRTGDERPLLPLIATAGLLLWWLGLRRPRLALVGSVVLALGLYSHAFGRLLIPALAAAFLALFVREIRRAWTVWGLAVVMLGAALVPVVHHSLLGLGQERFRIVVPVDKLDTLELVEYLISNYLSYFDPMTLYFGVGSSPRVKLGNFGPILPFMVPLIVAGLVRCLVSPSRVGCLLLWWLLVGPAITAFHNQSPSMDLLLGNFPVVMMLCGLGAAVIWEWLVPRSRILAIATATTVFAGVAWSAVNIGSELYQRYPRMTGGAWLAGGRDTVALLERLRGPDDRVAVSDRLLSPHVLVLFYTRVDPAGYQQDPIHLDWPDLRSRGTIGPYEFGRIERIMARPDPPRILWVTDDDAERVAPKRLPTMTARQPNGRIRWSVLDLR